MHETKANEWRDENKSEILIDVSYREKTRSGCTLSWVYGYLMTVLLTQIAKVTAM